MKLNGISQLKLLLDLYFSPYNHGKFGTIRDIAHELAEDSGYIRTTLSGFVKVGLFKMSRHEFKGKDINMYTLDIDAYLSFLFEVEIVKKCWMVILDNRTPFDDLYVPYDKEKVKKIKNYLSMLKKGACIQGGDYDGI